MAPIMAAKPDSAYAAYTAGPFSNAGSGLLRLLYTLTMYLLTPVILYRLAARGLRYRRYLSRWKERYGFFPAPGFENSSWVHAVSVGEVNAAVPLIEALMRRYPDAPMVVTTVTPTGSERVQRLFGDRVFHVYLPYDLPASVKRFLDRIRPRFAVIMETEIWPNLFITCRERDIPIVVTNARLSERSLRGYGPVRPLARRAIRCASFVAAQSPVDAERLRLLGAAVTRLAVIGNLKFDMPVPASLADAGAELRSSWGVRRPVWIAASTHEGEELPVLKAHSAVLQRFPDALLLIAPRHPERFKPVVGACRSLGFTTRVRSEDVAADERCQCFVVDTMGELLHFYAAADIAFVGGSLEPIGGHNLLEPAALGKPVIVGPHTFNTEEVATSLIEARAVLRVADEIELGVAVIRLLAQEGERHAMGQAAQSVLERERGAVQRTLHIVEQVLAKQPVTL
ncbi:MAG: lipid IV(A) 3-deoxy-D-manno-octulosonic acid transferase [Dokdonella sp.]|uniref:lipid IV(A) 3-deoxy-D-manno-octulosonic acid transferase n=1 Tax=Dokdonella sp. TaxID=2291710 RepID=UPI002BAB6B1C|nr:lipid IV(A) 3-deoxy-D-manno-octulosonic acid transferase [Dokdonella sp.]HOX70527.1 lipid IV(A) 3-deoxy-D-manno-octulosonic acid transferase [Dokdonella sp.]HPG94634.1 lipid IV(A) 3-deoxy-D-manno-octulosonic acid transferase [Dokdonella sp.]HPN78264.1 lipid IV(A) 3-deoxy-D-manno-octulosonic acid transferase [Dokdonella sp.]